MSNIPFDRASIWNSPGPGSLGVWLIVPGSPFISDHSSLNGVDQNLGLNLEYRLSPHVTLSVGEMLSKRHPTCSTQSRARLSVSGASAIAHAIPPTPTDYQLKRRGITYQFSQNAMVGAKGTFSGLWYPNRARTFRACLTRPREAAKSFILIASHEGITSG